jgi:hypothetical protein
MFGLLKNKPVLDAESTQWMLDVYAWSLHNFDAEIFYQHTVLVEPSNRFFPGRENSELGMANLIFDRVKHYAAVSHWPTSVVDHASCSIPDSEQIVIGGPLRLPDGSMDQSISQEKRLLIPYNPQQINNPEGLIATFAHTLAHYLGQMAKEPPPGGTEYWPHVTELLAIYLGFGLMFANSAYTFRGGCGSCYNANANRDAYLTEQQSVYALAIFGALKDIPDSAVTRNLKSHLRSFYKKAVKDIKSRVQDVDAFQKHDALRIPSSLS